MTVRDMIKRFHGRIDDYARAYWNDERAIGLINTFQDRMIQELGGLAVEYVENFDSVAGQQEYEVPANYVSNRLLYYDPTSSAYNYKITIMDKPDSIYGVFTDPTVTGYPSRGFISNLSGRQVLTIYPTFDVDGIAMRWWFWGWPTEVSKDNDVPAVPAAWHPSLVELMITQAKEDDKMIPYGSTEVKFLLETKRVKAMDVTKTIIERGGQYGSYDDSFDRIRVGSGADEIVLAPTPWRTS